MGRIELQISRPLSNCKLLVFTLIKNIFNFLKTEEPPQKWSYFNLVVVVQKSADRLNECQMTSFGIDLEFEKNCIS